MAHADCKLRQHNRLLLCAVGFNVSVLRMRPLRLGWQRNLFKYTKNWGANWYRSSLLSGCQPGGWMIFCRCAEAIANAARRKCLLVLESKVFIDILMTDASIVIIIYTFVQVRVRVRVPNTRASSCPKIDRRARHELCVCLWTCWMWVGRKMPIKTRLVGWPPRSVASRMYMPGVQT